MSSFLAPLLWLSSFAVGQVGSAPAPQDEAVQSMHTYGYCVVERAPNRSRRVLAVPPGSREERELLESMATNLCLSGHGYVSDIRFQPQLLRGVIAEAVLDRHIARGAGRGRGDMVMPFSGLQMSDITALDERGRQALRALDFAQCIVSAAPQSVTTLLRTAPTSAEENLLFQQLAPHFGPCLAQGAQMNIVKPQLRGFLAEAAYRSAYAAANGPK